MSNAPILEEFGLNESVYNDFRHKKESLNSSLDSCNSTINSIENNWFINLILVVLFFATWFFGIYLVYQFSVAFNFSGAYEWIPLFIISIITWVIFLLPVFFEEKFNIVRLVRNLFTAGKYNKAIEENKVIEYQIEKITENVKGRVGPFEEAYHNYYKNKLDEFYLTKLYKKRSGTPEFEESLSEFELMLNDLSGINKVFLTSSFSSWELREYSEYIKKRKTNHGVQQKKLSMEFKPVSDFVKKFTQTQTKTIPITPEEKYQIPRKIDWDKLYKDRKATGIQGEEVAIAIEQEYLKSIGRDDLANKIRHVSKEDGDGLGYDILSFFQDGSEKYIEVKSTTKSLEAPFYISRNELSFLQEHPENSFIYRLLLNCEYVDNLQISSCADFFESKELVPTQYVVKNKAYKGNHVV